MENNNKSKGKVGRKQELAEANELLHQATKEVKFNVIKERIIKSFREDIPLAIDITKETENLSSEILHAFFKSLESSFPELANEAEYQNAVGLCLATRKLYKEATGYVGRAIGLAREDYRHWWLMSEILFNAGDDGFLDYEIKARELVNEDLTLLKFSLREAQYSIEIKKESKRGSATNRT